MKKTFKQTLAAIAMGALLVAVAACGKDNPEPTPAGNDTDEQAAKIAARFVDYTVAPTYSALAQQTEQLANELAALKANPTQAALDAACTTFLAARAEWEKSEAFLFGAAGDFGIDPHIDSWPFDESYFNALMASPSMIAKLDAANGDEEAYNTLSNSNLGFHSLEYIMFKDGHPKDVALITGSEWIYAVAVAGDLRNNCYRLEVSWLGDAAPESHIAKLDDLEWAYTVGSGDLSYGDNMKRAGQPGSTYSSRVAGLMAIASGCVDIADEVGSSKINSAYALGDETYIESPYSQMSITDFHNNIVSIQNVYYGGVEGQRDESLSLHSLVHSVNAELDGRVVAAIDGALAAIDAMPHPFVNNIHAAENGTAVEACAALSEVLDEVVEALGEL